MKIELWQSTARINNVQVKFIRVAWKWQKLQEEKLWHNLVMTIFKNRNKLLYFSPQKDKKYWFIGSMIHKFYCLSREHLISLFCHNFRERKIKIYLISQILDNINWSEFFPVFLFLTIFFPLFVFKQFKTH